MQVDETARAVGRAAREVTTTSDAGAIRSALGARRRRRRGLAVTAAVASLGLAWVALPGVTSGGLDPVGSVEVGDAREPMGPDDVDVPQDVAAAVTEDLFGPGVERPTYASFLADGEVTFGELYDARLLTLACFRDLGIPTMAPWEIRYRHQSGGLSLSTGHDSQFGPITAPEAGFCHDDRGVRETWVAQASPGHEDVLRDAMRACLEEQGFESTLPPDVSRQQVQEEALQSDDGHDAFGTCWQSFEVDIDDIDRSITDPAEIALPDA